MGFQNATPQATRVNTGRALIYTNGGTAVADGQVIVVATIPYIAIGDIPANTAGSLADSGVYDVIKDASVFADGDPVFWNPTGNPNSGTAGAGAATSSAVGAFLIGVVVPGGAALTGANTVRLRQRSALNAQGIVSVNQPPGASTAAAGTTTADAGVLPAATAAVYPTTAADGTKGVRVNVADKVTGRTILIGNGVAASALKAYGPSGATINGAAADAAYVGGSGKGVIMYCLNATTNTWLAWG
jgi:predicted RecA/RadA family phage recombinase